MGFPFIIKIHSKNYGDEFSQIKQMKEKIRKLIKEQIDNIFESGGKQDDLNEHSKGLSELIVSFLGNYIKNNKDKLYDGYEWEFSRKEIINTDYFKKNTLIGGIKLIVNYNFVDIIFLFFVSVYFK